MSFEKVGRSDAPQRDDPTASEPDEVAPDEVAPDEVALDDALLPRLRVIEEQPLDQRAAAYAHLHDELRDRLEGGDSPRSQG
ncbi:hypothetical protein [Luethyella okanaganae]|uniref:Uncharacterized protein n=1 Tax=Luethyella okanaganae TaxID=69372 RepID=A0ABW1VGY4_9MICO